MALPRFIVDLLPQGPSPTSVRLSTEESHHLTRVLRLQPGDEAELFVAAEERAFKCVVAEAHPERSTVVVIGELTHLAPTRVTLLVALVRREKVELLIEKCVELGAAAIHCFYAERSQSPVRGEKLHEKERRLLRIRDAALKQSHSSRYTRIALHSTLEEALQAASPSPQAATGSMAAAQRYICLSDEEAAAAGISQVPLLIELIPPRPSATELPTGEAPTALENNPQTVETHVLIGPEGGFTASEVELAGSYNYLAARLAPAILRTETAAILAAGLLQLLGERQLSLPPKRSA